jgi:hypothetical protein
MSAEAAEETKGPGIVLQPEEGQSYWQPINRVSSSSAQNTNGSSGN